MHLCAVLLSGDCVRSAGVFRARLDPNGDESKPILGIALDGSTGVALVADSDGGKYDGDPTLDRAVGPMQFILGPRRCFRPSVIA